MWKGATWIPSNFPLGLNGMLAGKTAAMAANPVEELVVEAQESVARDVRDRGELWRQAMYQYLYGMGHRIPTDLPSELRRLAVKESREKK